MHVRIHVRKVISIEENAWNPNFFIASKCCILREDRMLRDFFHCQDTWRYINIGPFRKCLAYVYRDSWEMRYAQHSDGARGSPLVEGRCVKFSFTHRRKRIWFVIPVGESKESIRGCGSRNRPWCFNSLIRSHTCEFSEKCFEPGDERILTRRALSILISIGVM
jgi:hypothetical protein